MGKDIFDLCLLAMLAYNHPLTMSLSYVYRQDHAFDLHWAMLDAKKSDEFMDSSLIPFLTQYLK
jgi:hypothetical protein